MDITDLELDDIKRIHSVLVDGLRFVSKYEKLSSNEGQIKVIFNADNTYGIEIYAPHIIPNSLSYTWTGETWGRAVISCMSDLMYWIEIEKDAPRDKFWLDN